LIGAENMIQEGMWKGDRAFLVGGGSSLENFDWDLLAAARRAPRTRVAVVNMAIEKCADFADILVWKDRVMYVYQRDVFNAFSGLKCAYDLGEDNLGPEGTVFLKVKMEEGISTSLEEGLCHGNNSGYLALNLIYLLGCNPIFLLGIDGGPVNGKLHFHPEPPGLPSMEEQEVIYGAFRDNYDAFGGSFLERGVHVFNLSPISRVKSFPKFDPALILPS